MSRSNVARIAVLSLMVGTGLTGCSSAKALFANIGVGQPHAAEGAGPGLAAKAEKSLAKQQLSEAIGFAEQAVEAAPKNAAYRNLLGRSYLSAGRFASAAQSFQDAIDLGDNSGRVSMNLALAKIALGDHDGALVALDQARSSVPAADYGLGIALAGKVDQAIEVLERAARSENATARDRQNLALAYALAGRWMDARTTASQDVAPQDLKTRMEQWSQFSRPANVYDQVASLLKVTPHEDPGQPTRLALNASATVTAQVNDTGAVEQFAPKPATEAEFADAAPAAAAPVPAAFTVDTAEPAVAAADSKPLTPDYVDVPAPKPQQAAATPAPKAAVVRPSSVAAAHPAVLTKPRVAGGKQGKYVVQIGAYTKRSVAQVAWNRAVTRNGELASSTSMIAAIQGGRIYRLSAGGFETRADANATCAAIRQSGTACFVRASLGDKPTQWVSAAPAKARAKSGGLTQVASR